MLSYTDFRKKTLKYEKLLPMHYHQTFKLDPKYYPWASKLSPKQHFDSEVMYAERKSQAKSKLAQEQYYEHFLMLMQRAAKEGILKAQFELGMLYKKGELVNQNYEKDISGVVTGMKFPEDLNTLYLAAKVDIDVSDAGVVNVDKLQGKEIAIINYMSNGKYKRNTWSVVSSWDGPRSARDSELCSTQRDYHASIRQ